MRATWPAFLQELTLWNQKGTDTGSLLFARMAASYSGSHGGLLQWVVFTGVRSGFRVGFYALVPGSRLCRS